MTTQKKHLKHNKGRKVTKTQKFQKWPNWEDNILNIIPKETGVGKKKIKKQDIKEVRKNIEKVTIRISKDYPIYITETPKEENQINREQEKLNLQVRKAFFGKKKIRLILKEKILAKIGSKSQTKTDFIKHNNPVGIQTKKQPIC